MDREVSDSPRAGIQPELQQDGGKQDHERSLVLEQYLIGRSRQVSTKMYKNCK